MKVEAHRLPVVMPISSLTIELTVEEASRLEVALRDLRAASGSVVSRLQREIILALTAS